MDGLFLIGLSIVGGFLVWLISYLAIKHEYPRRKAYYSGKQLMSDEEFLIFKKAAVDEDVYLTVTELNSRAPIYVDFHVSLPHTKTFPFGKRTEDSKWDCAFNHPLSMAVIIILSFVSLFLLAIGLFKLLGFSC